MSNLNPTQFSQSIPQEGSPRCEHCGEQIRYNTKAAGIPSDVYQEGGLLNGWSHPDGKRRDHEATPPMGTSGEAELARTNARIDQAKMAMREHIKSRFNEVALGNAVDEVLK